MNPAIISALEDLAGVLVEALPKLVELFKHGGKDAVLTALDGALVVARAKTDEDLAAKHAHDAPPPAPSSASSGSSST
jgi:hypothetical protein